MIYYLIQYKIHTIKHCIKYFNNIYTTYRIQNNTICLLKIDNILIQNMYNRYANTIKLNNLYSVVNIPIQKI